MKSSQTILLRSAFVAATFAALLPFCSCDTVKEIPDGLSSAQLIQLGQNAYAGARYRSAEAYYNAVLDRYGDDAATYVEARFELGHVYLKQKRYAEAYAVFTGLLDIYATSQPGALPGAFQKLAQIDLAKIPEKHLPKTEEVALPETTEYGAEEIQTDYEETAARTSYGEASAQTDYDESAHGEMPSQGDAAAAQEPADTDAEENSAQEQPEAAPQSEETVG